MDMAGEVPDLPAAAPGFNSGMCKAGDFRSIYIFSFKKPLIQARGRLPRGARLRGCAHAGYAGAVIRLRAACAEFALPV